MPRLNWEKHADPDKLTYDEEQKNELSPFHGNEEKKPKGLNPLFTAAIFGGNMLDVASTKSFRDYEKAMNLSNGEANPLMKWLVDSTPGMLAVKSGSSALQGYLYDKISKSGHPNLAKVAAVASAVLPGVVGANNFRQVNNWKENNPYWREGIRGKVR